MNFLTKSFNTTGRLKPYLDYKMCKYELEKRIYGMDVMIRTIKLLGAALSSLSSTTGLAPFLRAGLQSPSLLQYINGPKEQGKKGSFGSSPPAVKVVTLRSALITAEASPRACFVLNWF